MFTGLVEAVGELIERKATSGGVRLRVASPLAGELSPGDGLLGRGLLSGQHSPQRGIIDLGIVPLVDGQTGDNAQVIDTRPGGGLAQARVGQVGPLCVRCDVGGADRHRAFHSHPRIAGQVPSTKGAL